MDYHRGHDVDTDASDTISTVSGSTVTLETESVISDTESTMTGISGITSLTRQHRRRHRRRRGHRDKSRGGMRIIDLACDGQVRTPRPLWDKSKRKQRHRQAAASRHQRHRRVRPGSRTSVAYSTVTASSMTSETVSAVSGADSYGGSSGMSESIETASIATSQRRGRAPLGPFTGHSSTATSTVAREDAMLFAGAFGDPSAAPSDRDSRRRKGRRHRRHHHPHQHQHHQRRGHYPPSSQQRAPGGGGANGRIPSASTAASDMTISTLGGPQDGGGFVGGGDEMDGMGGGVAAGPVQQRDLEDEVRRKNKARERQKRTFGDEFSFFSPLGAEERDPSVLDEVDEFSALQSPSDGIGMGMGMGGVPVDAVGAGAVSSSAEEGGTGADGQPGSGSGAPALSASEAKLLQSDFEIDLAETPTIMLFDRFQESVSNADPILEQVKTQNKAFEKLREDRLLRPMLFVEDSAQTRETFKKNKYTTIKTRNVEDGIVGVREYEILDMYESIRREEEERELAAAAAAAAALKGAELADQSDDDDEDEGEDDDDDMDKDELEEVEERDVFKLGSFRASLVRTERLVVLNSAMAKVMDFLAVTPSDYAICEAEERTSEGEVEEVVEVEKLPAPEEETAGERRHSILSQLGLSPQKNRGEVEKEEEPPSVESSVLGRLDLMWEFYCEELNGLAVNGISPNPIRSNILAAAYGNVKFELEEGSVVNSRSRALAGCVLCWNLKNLRYPERRYAFRGSLTSLDTPIPVSLDFSNSNPHLLAVGFSEGTVAIFDVRSHANEPVLRTSKSHSSTVWDLAWIPPYASFAEKKTSSSFVPAGDDVLHTVGADGRVNVWSMKKGLDSTEIMRIRNSSVSSLATSTAPQDRYGNIVSREIGGLSIAFDPNDSSQYLVATEYGGIVKCSTTHSSHCLGLFQGHTGPVFRLRFDPLNSNRFISCSSDWTVRIWNSFSESARPNVTGAAAAGGETEKGGGRAASVQMGECDMMVECSARKTSKRSCSIVDVDWCRVHDPKSADCPQMTTAFAFCSVTGEVELWDTAYSVFRASAIRKLDERPTSLRFLKGCVTVGMESGRIGVFRPAFGVNAVE